MISTKQKWISVAFVLVLLLACAGFRLFYDKPENPDTQLLSRKDLEGKQLGGVVAKMPDSSAKIFFEGILGTRLSGYQSFSSPEGALNALRNNSIQAFWAADVTASYLLKTESGLRVLEQEEATEERLQFAFAFREEDEKLREQCNQFLDDIAKNGKRDELVERYIDNAETADPFRPEDMTENEGKVLYVGVTGAVPPIECIDDKGEPYGFCVAFSDLLGQALSRRVKFVVLDNETIFTELMGGRVDLVFCYGTSKNHSTEFPAYMMSTGYYPMKEYCFLVSDQPQK